MPEGPTNPTVRVSAKPCGHLSSKGSAPAPMSTPALIVGMSDTAAPVPKDVHTPARQARAWAHAAPHEPQSFPQAPQFVRLSLRSTLEPHVIGRAPGQPALMHMPDMQLCPAGQVAPSSTAPSQSSSTLLQVSVGAGVPGTALHIGLPPVQATIPVRRHAPRPAEHASPSVTQALPQTICPDGQLWPQVPAAHVAEPSVGAGHTRLHMPQWFTSVWRLRQVAVIAVGVQSVCPVGQRATVAHTPLAHIWPIVQARPQPPQWAGSDVVSTQPAPHMVLGAAQEAPPVHAPPTQVWPAIHARPQPPQLALSVVVFTQRSPQAVGSPQRPLEDVTV